MPIKAVIFDGDRTLVDTVDPFAASWREAPHKGGVNVSLPEKVVAQEGTAPDTSRKRISPDGYPTRARIFTRGTAKSSIAARSRPCSHIFQATLEKVAPSGNVVSSTRSLASGSTSSTVAEWCSPAGVQQGASDSILREPPC